MRVYSRHTHHMRVADTPTTWEQTHPPYANLRTCNLLTASLINGSCIEVGLWRQKAIIVLMNSCIDASYPHTLTILLNTQWLSTTGRSPTLHYSHSTTRSPTHCHSHLTTSRSPTHYHSHSTTNRSPTHCHSHFTTSRSPTHCHSHFTTSRSPTHCHSHFTTSRSPTHYHSHSTTNGSPTHCHSLHH